MPIHHSSDDMTTYSRGPLLLLLTASISNAQPVVTNNLDGAPPPEGSLRWAISTAAAADTASKVPDP